MEPVNTMAVRDAATRAALEQVARNLRRVTPPTPVGTLWFSLLMPSAVTDPWLYCDGRLVSKQRYPQLYRVVRGMGDSGASTETDEMFRLPDFRDCIITGVPAVGTSDLAVPGGKVSFQDGATTSHTQAYVTVAVLAR